jgi:hypothetical protein
MTTGRINQVTFVRPEYKRARSTSSVSRITAATNTTASRAHVHRLDGLIDTNASPLRLTGDEADRTCVCNMCVIQTIKCHRPVRQHDTKTPLYTEGEGRVLWCDLFGFFVLLLSRASYKCNRAVDRVCAYMIHVQANNQA